MTRREAVRLRIGESKPRIVLSLATPPLLVALAWGAWLLEMAWPVVLILAALAAFLGYVAAVDFPLAIEVTDRGIDRICLLGRRRVGWDDVAGLVQPRRKGLILVTAKGKKRILLDRSLDDEELGRLRSLARSHRVSTSF